jgi:hypothetical protein
MFKITTVDGRPIGIHGFYSIKLTVIHLAITEIYGVAVFERTILKDQIIDTQHRVAPEGYACNFVVLAFYGILFDFDAAVHGVRESIMKNCHSILSFSMVDSLFFLLDFGFLDRSDWWPRKSKSYQG